MNNPNLDKLIAAADALRPLLPELVFVGGCVAGLLMTDAAAGQPRGTVDVDAIAAIRSYAQYVAFGDRLRAIGFNEDTREGAPLCRWVRGTTTMDIMPLDRGILGFSNRWYEAAMESAVARRISSSLEIRVATAPCFIATKLEAFRGRGAGDFLASHDLEDVISVIDGRETLAAEVRDAGPELSAYVSQEVVALLHDPDFINALPGLLYPDAASQSRLSIVLARLKTLATK